MGETVIQRAFAGGELAPALSARADLVKYQTGLRTCRNFQIRRHGGASNRAGLRFVNGSKNNSTNTFILRYVSEVAGESLLLEAGPLYLRVYKNGALVRLTGVVAWDAGTNYAIGDIVVSGGVNYYAVKAGLNHVPPNATYWYAMPSDILEIPTPFGSPFAWHQSGTTITLTHQSVRPYELIYVALTHWVIRAVDTAPSLLPPTNLTIVGGVAGTREFKYVVSAVDAETYEESLAGPITQVSTIDKPTADHPNVLSWTAVAGAGSYYVYCDPYGNGTFGFVGTATGQTTFNDVGFTPDFLVTPPLPRILFTTSGNYPGTSATYQQRRWFASTVLNPDAVWGSRTGFPSNFAISSPLQDDDAITFRIIGNQHHPVRHLVGLKSLIALTDGGVWPVVGATSKIIAPNSIDAEQETYVGISPTVVPVVAGNAIIYVQARGALVRDVKFDFQVEGLGGRDLTLFAAHLFDGYTIDEIDYAYTPHSIVWGCRSDGTLLGMTYLEDQDVVGWHRHDTGAGGRFEDVCVVPEPGEDAVYVLVRRTIGGVFKRYIERLETREIFSFAADCFFVDSGLSYSGAPVTSVSGLSHLEGQVVAVVADGAVVYNGDPAGTNAALYTVAAGAITLPAAASIVHVGLAITADLESLDLDVAGSSVRDKKKRIGGLALLLEASARTFAAGPEVTRLVPYQLRPYETGAGLPFTGQVELAINSDYNEDGRVFIRHTDPLPLTVLGLLPNVELGG